jgi:homoserine kinase
LGIGHYRKFDWAPEIKAIAIIPDFVVPTANARSVLPQTYTRADVVRSSLGKLNAFPEHSSTCLTCPIFKNLSDV